MRCTWRFQATGSTAARSTRRSPSFNRLGWRNPLVATSCARGEDPAHSGGANETVGCAVGRRRGLPLVPALEKGASKGAVEDHVHQPGGCRSPGNLDLLGLEGEGRGGGGG